ncbi:MAG: LytTR family DNA-binding domain-containing protein [Lachnospiraceae bacterium]|nr:LytTR family DNA-binding domain-containing protein [Lachnospiraceae bacterium]
MQIAICDDIQNELETIRAALDTYAKAHPELRFDIDEYVSAIDILNAVEKGKTYDIALLDICMPGVLGTDVAEEMLAKCPDMGIVFLSTSDEYAVTAFALNATHYLVKPFSQEQFNEALARAVRKTEDRDFLSLACVDGMYRVCVTEIVSIESQNHYLLINLSSGELLKLRMKLSQMFEELQKYSGFIKVGASYVVNLAFARRISGNTLEMFNGVKISIPRRSSEEVQKIYMDFCRKEALK